MLKLEKAKDSYVQQFQQTKVVLQAALSSAEVHHVGSTAVPGLGGKGIIDILVAVPDWEKKTATVEALNALGYTHIHPEENERIFMSRVGDTKAGDVHIHLTFIGSEQSRVLLLFRDYLLAHPERAKEYGEGKVKWLKEAKGDRKTYAKLKSNWIGQLIQQINSKIIT